MHIKFEFVYRKTEFSENHSKITSKTSLTRDGMTIYVHFALNVNNSITLGALREQYRKSKKDSI